MPDSVTISKTRSSFPDYLDFFHLRKLGIEHIQELGSDIWTDYNLHDPGITILEVLCYALTDLGYRNNLDIKDLLTRSEEQKAKEELTVFNLPRDNNFFTAAEILSCNPVTITDFRKLLIDIPGVKNAWLEIAEKGEIPIYLNEKARRLQYLQPQEFTCEPEVKIQGLYDLCVELEPFLETDACGRSFFTTEDILSKVYETMNAHRNLCEDIRHVVVFGEEEIGICSDIELAPDADPEDVLLEIYKRLEEFLSPTLRFYTLQQLLDKGKRVEEIFEGRPLTAESHGFIDTEDLKKMEPRKKLYASDLIEIIMDVPGVLAVHKFVFTNYVNGLEQTKGEKWCLDLTPKYLPHLTLDLPKTRITFYKESLPFKANLEEVKQRYQEEKIANTKVLLDPYELDLSIPEGTYRELEEYETIQNDFPLTYGIGEPGIKGIRTKLRQAQALQLKAYLLFFDQILANYLSQLAHVRSLFSFRPDDHPVRQECNGHHTYFVQLLSEVPRVKELIRNFNGCPADEGYLPVPENYPDYLEFIAESLVTYQDRRNRFLDHLLARFAESFSEYVLLMFKMEGGRQDLAKIIQDKADFLQNYPELSRNRGKAFNYRPKVEEGQNVAGVVWNTAHISGLERRVSKLLGIDKVGRFSLSRAEVVAINEGWCFEVLDESGELCLESKEIFPDEESAQNAFENLLLLGSEEHYYRRVDFQEASGATEYSLLIVDDHNKIIAQCAQRFPTEERREIAIQRIINTLRTGGLRCGIFQSQECFFFELYNATGEQLWFKSARGYLTAPEAAQAYLRFVALATNRENYELFFAGTGEGFGFHLWDEETGEILAEHPFTYTTEAERDDRLQTIIYYLDETPPNYVLEEEYPGSFEFEVKDSDGNVLFVSARTYETEAEARAGFQLLQKLARFRVYYRMIDDQTGDEPFSFELIDRRGELLAIHPRSYATDCERDWVVDSIIYCSSNEEVSAHIVPEGDGFVYQLQDREGKVLMQSQESYTDETAAEDGWIEFMDFAGSQSNYRPVTLEGDPKPFTFQLLNGDEAPIAFHPDSYEFEAERNAALQAVVNFVCHTLFLVNISGEQGSYYFKLLGYEDRVLLRSTNAYPDRESARMAYHEFLPPARKRDHYNVLTGDGFEVQNDLEESLASNDEEYPTDGAREATIDMIIAYLRDDPVQHRIVNEEGAYRAQIFDQHGKLVLTGSQIYYSNEETQAGIEIILSHATAPSNYQAHNEGKGDCQYGFNLTGESGEILAVHPFHYPDAPTRDQVMADLFAYLSSGVHLEESALRINSESGYSMETGSETSSETYSYEITDFTGSTLLIIDRVFTNEEGPTFARNYFLQTFLPLAVVEENYNLDYNNELCYYTIELMTAPGSSERIAHHPVRFSSRKERDEIFQDILCLLREHAIDTRVEGTDCGYYFEWTAPSIRLRSRLRYPTVELALQACNAAGEQAWETGSCQLREEEEGNFVEWLASDGSVVVETVEPLSSGEEVEDLCEQLATLMMEPTDVSAGLVFKSRAYGCRVADEENVWLEGIGRAEYQVHVIWPDRYESPGRRQEEIDAFMEFVDQSDPEPEFESTTGGETYYALTFGDTGEEYRLVSRMPFEDEEQARTAFDQFIDDAGKEENYHLIEDKENGWFGFELINEESRQKAYEKACEGCKKLVVESQDEDRFRLISNRDDCYFGFELLDAAGQLLATHPASYATAESRSEAITFLSNWVNAEGMHLVEHILLRPHNEGVTESFAFAFKEEDTVLFQSVFPYSREAEALAAFLQTMQPFLDYAPPVAAPPGFRIYELFDPETGQETLYSYEIIDIKGDTLASTGRCFAGLDEVYADIQHTKDLLESCEEVPTGVEETGSIPDTGETGITGEEECIPFSEDEEAIRECIFAIPRSRREREQDRLLPPVGDCDGANDKLCAESSDPYSFRASVVLPYWPERFRQPEFRAFIERTLRKEAPAHVFLRICWVDPCQMREFEKAYRRWLESMALGNDSCDSTGALNELVNILFDLRNVYPEARLAECDEVNADNNPVILNQTVLGNANSINNDNG